MLLLPRKQGLFESARIKRGKEKLPLPQHPLWQPEFPGRMDKMKNPGNAPVGIAPRYSFFKVVFTFLNPALQVAHYCQKQASNRKSLL